MEVTTKSDCAMGDKLEELSSSDITEEVAELKKEVAHVKVEVVQINHEEEQFKDELAKLKGSTLCVSLSPNF